MSVKAAPTIFHLGAQGQDMKENLLNGVTERNKTWINLYTFPHSIQNFLAGVRLYYKLLGTQTLHFHPHHYSVLCLETLPFP